MINKILKSKNQKGAVSLFVVVFAALLITVVVVSFTRIMINDQQQASTVDLSQSAYDSAQAGVEDGKRALLRYQNVCNDSDIASCNKAADVVNSAKCNAGLENISTVVDGEVKIQQRVGDNALDQAYTCVKIALNTNDYLGTLQTDSSNVIPLFSKAPFDTVLLEWYTADDLQSHDNLSVDLLPASSFSFPLINSWPINRPSIMRTQLMQVGSNFTLNDFDSINSAGQSNANTLFLYPLGTTGISSNTIDSKDMAARDLRRSSVSGPQPTTCSGSLTSGGYACSTKLVLPVPVNGGNRTAFLRLTSMYNKAHYRVLLLDSTKPCDLNQFQGLGCIQFDGIQPEIDSTGRANDLFRRVVSRVELRDVNYPYPDAAVNVTGNLCKDFLVTNKTTDYKNNCTP